MQNRLTIRDATPEDAISLTPRLRKVDLLEAKRAGLEDERAVLESLVGAAVEGTLAWSVVDEAGVVQAMGGLEAGVGAPNAALIWLVTSDEFVRRHSREFLRRIRPILRALCAPYDFVWNSVDAENHVHIRWLRWAGFHVSEPMQEDDGYPPFHILSWRNPPCAFP